MRKLWGELAGRLPLQFRILYSQFLLRVIDLEALSIEADIPRFLGQFAGVLILISLLKAVGTLWFPPPPEFALAVEQGQIANMLLVAGLIVVVSWDATFPDRRDVMVLAPLPVRPRTILVAKVAASAALLGIAIAALNFASSVAYAVVFGGWGLLRFLAAYWFTMTMAAALMYGSVLTVQGITAMILPRRQFMTVSAALQLVAYALVLGGYFLLPTLPTWTQIAAQENHWVVTVSPVFGLLAILNQLNGTLPGACVWIAERAWIQLAALTIAAAGSLMSCYLLTMKRTVEQPDLVPGAGGAHWSLRLGTPLRTAVVQFCLRSLARSRQHRVIFAFYLSVVFAITLSWIRSMVESPSAQPIPVEFLMSSVIIMAFAVFGLRAVFSLPVSLHANWILRITQLHPTKSYIAAARLSLLLFAMLPAWLLIAAVSLAFRPLSNVAGHLAAMLLLGWSFVEVAMVRFEKVPFTCSCLPGKTNVQVVFWTFSAAMLVFAFQGARYEIVALGDPRQYATMVSFLAGALICLWIFNFRRARVAQLYFEETFPITITTLGIATWIERGPAFDDERK